MSKLKDKFFVLCVVCCFYASCSNDEFLEQTVETEKQELTDNEMFALDIFINGSKSSYDEILDKVAEAVSFLDAAEPTKSIAGRHVSSIYEIGKCATKSGESQDDAFAYVANFDGEGFAVISADRRTDDILALSSAGSFDVNTLEQDYYDGKIPVDALILMSNIEEIINLQIDDFNKDYDQLAISAMEKLSSESMTKSISGIKVTTSRQLLTSSNETPTPRTTVSDWKTVASGSIEPMVKTTWGQGAPFNNMTPIQDGYHTMTGCVPTAIAQVMNYWCFPLSYDWASISPFSHGTGITKAPESVKNEVAKLMFDIGKSINVSYGLDGTSAHSKDAVSFFKKMGYRNAGTYDDFDEAKTLSSLYHGCPVIVSGGDIKEVKNLVILGAEIRLSTVISGHCWIIDGALRQGKTTTVSCDGNIISQTTQYRTLFHCNYGWNSLHDGYYASEAFNINEGPITKCIVTDEYGEKLNFQYELHGIYDIAAY